jgi:hypothetical protein
MSDPLTFHSACSAVRQFLETVERPTRPAVFNFARDLLCQSIPGEVSEPNFELVVAVVATSGLELSLSPGAVQPGSDRGKLLDGLRRQLHPWLVLAGLAIRLSGSSPVSIAGLAVLESRAADFIRALRPHRVWGESRTSLNQRLDAFVGWIPHPDAAVEAWAGHAIDSLRPKVRPRRRTRFFERVPTDRLRICDEEMLSEIVGFFRKWDPLIQFLEGTGTKKAEMAQVLDDLCRSLAKSLRKIYPRIYAGSDAEDAVQNAITRLTETAKEPHEGYTYERHLVAWLMTTARYDISEAVEDSKLEIALSQFDDPEP